MKARDDWGRTPVSGPLDADWRRAADALRAGGAVVLPTDTVYGVGALPSVPGATAALFALKDRDRTRPLAVLVADDEQAMALIEPQTEPVLRLIDRFWPGPLTLVLRRSASAAGYDLGADSSTIGVRCPDHDRVRALAAEVGPTATTSANRHGEPTPPTAREAAAALSGAVEVVLDGGRLDGQASTVVDCTGVVPVVLRAGALPPEAVTTELAR